MYDFPSVTKKGFEIFPLRKLYQISYEIIHSTAIYPAVVILLYDKTLTIIHPKLEVTFI